MNVLFFSAFVLLILVGYMYMEKFSEEMHYSDFHFSRHVSLRREYLVLLVLAFSLLAATRLDYFDTNNYRAFYSSIEDMNLHDLLNDAHFEPGFGVFSKILRSCGVGFTQYLFIFPVINSLIILIALETFRINSVKGMILYYSTIGIYYNFVVLQQGISISFLFLGYSFYKNKKSISAIMCILLATFFHRSSMLIALVFAFSSMIKVNRRSLFLISVVSLCIYIFGASDRFLLSLLNNIFGRLPAMFERYYYYFRDNIEVSSFSLFYFGMLFFNCLVLFANRKRNIDPEAFRHIVIGYLIFSLFSGIPIAARILHFFNLFYLWVFDDRMKHNKMLFFVFNSFHFIFYFRFIIVETVLFI